MKTSQSHIYSGSDEILTLDTDLVDRIELLHDNILLAKCVQDHIRDEDGSVLVAMTDEYVDTTVWCEVLKIGKECKYLRPEHLERQVFMHIPEWEGRGWNKVGDNLFVISEKLMDKKNPLLKPFIYIED